MEQRFHIDEDVLGWVVVDHANDPPEVVFQSAQYVTAKTALYVFEETAGGVNLDGETPRWLQLFATIAHQAPRELARNIWGRTDDEARDLMWRLETYAAKKAAAMRAREEGNIVVALALESACDRVYQELPEWARCW